MTVFDAVPFFNELDVYEVRLATLNDAVDVFVACEAPYTYRGDDKPLLLSDSLRDDPERWAPWRHKMRVVVADPPPHMVSHQGGEANDRWSRENHQRRSLQLGMPDLQDDDVILLSDCDEIVRPGLVDWYVSEDMQHILRPVLPMHVYLPEWRWDRGSIPVIARLFRGRAVMPQAYAYDGHVRGLDLEEVRQLVGGVLEQPPEGVGHLDARCAWGWHLSYLGGVDAMRYKVRQAAHPELEHPDRLTDEYLTRCLEDGVDIFGREWHRCERVGDDRLPPYLVEHRTGRFARLFNPLGGASEDRGMAAADVRGGRPGATRRRTPRTR